MKCEVLSNAHLASLRLSSRNILLLALRILSTVWLGSFRFISIIIERSIIVSDWLPIPDMTLGHQVEN